jgi:hypothetical protein
MAIGSDIFCRGQTGAKTGSIQQRLLCQIDQLFLGRPDEEAPGHQHSVPGVGYPRKGLCADDLPPPDVDLGLVAEHEVAACNRSLERKLGRRYLLTVELLVVHNFANRREADRFLQQLFGKCELGLLENFRKVGIE